MGADHDDFITNYFHLRPSEVLQRDNRRQASTVQHIPRIRKKLDREPQVPHLVNQVL